MKKSKSVILTIVAVLALIVFVVGVSYAWFQTTQTGGTNTIQTGTLTITFTNDARINLENAMPMNDESGYALTGVGNISSYSLTNTGTLPIQYRVILLAMTASEIQIELGLGELPTILSDTLLKYSLVTGGDTPSSGAALLSEVQSIEGVTGYVLETGTLDAVGGETTEVSKDLRLWVDSTATIETAANTYFGAKIKVQVLQQGGGATWTDYTAG